MNNKMTKKTDFSKIYNKGELRTEKDYKIYKKDFANKAKSILDNNDAKEFLKKYGF